MEWYGKHLNMDFVLAIAEDHVPSTKAPDPYMHLFLDAGHGNVLAFFELPNSPPMGRDTNTPGLGAAHRLQGGQRERRWKRPRPGWKLPGIPVVGVTDHTIFKSIYFFDPNGHRLELAADVGTPEMYKNLDEVKWEMLEEWSRTKRAPKHAAWMHDKEFKALD